MKKWWSFSEISWNKKVNEKIDLQMYHLKYSIRFIYNANYLIIYKHLKLIFTGNDYTSNCGYFYNN